MRSSIAPLPSLLALLILPGLLAAESSRSTGPVFEAFGAVFDGVEADYMPPRDDYKLIFDVWIGPDDPAAGNPRLETLARFMNMNARAGIAVERMQLALVLHGSAGRAALGNEAYRARFGVDNPDLALLEALTGRGVRVLFCGQSAAARGYPRAAMIEPVEMALSAYTAILGLQQEGYALLPSWR